jgi:hypothetical protein
MASGLCECGCGGATPIAKQTHRGLRWIKGQPIRYINGHYAPPRKTLAERFWPKVDRRNPEDCWEWKASTTNKGYGCIAPGGATGHPLGAHRVAWTLTNGPIPAGLCVLHRCDNPPCCNPAHLFLGTILENNADMIAKGRHSKPPILRGEQATNAHLSAADVRQIRELYRMGGISRSALGRRFGIVKSAIDSIIARKSWIGAAYEPENISKGSVS